MLFPQQQHHSRFSPHPNTFASPKGSTAKVSAPWGKSNQFIGIKTSSLGWHFRVGHPSSDIVSRVVKNYDLPLSVNEFNKGFVCISCQLGKGKHQPFSLSNRVSFHPLDLIHTNVWASPISSVGGYKYYVVFIDDFSRFTWFYPLYNKAKVFDTFVKFKLLVGNQLSTSITQLEYDGGGEYTSLQFQSFLTKNGIIHDKSNPFTSQQNGLTERKLSHILEMVITYNTLSSFSFVQQILG
jgi:transposase InsO family protein